MHFFILFMPSSYSSTDSSLQTVYVIGVMISSRFIWVVIWHSVGSWNCGRFCSNFCFDALSWVPGVSVGTHGEYGCEFGPIIGVNGLLAFWSFKLKSSFTGTTTSFFGDFFVVARLTTLVWPTFFTIGNFSGELRACVSLNLLNIDCFGVLPNNFPCGIC